MKTRVIHRKLLYVPGMISLVVLPILLMCYFYDAQKSFVQYGSMDLGLPERGSMKQMKKDFPLLTNRNYQMFTFNGSLESEIKELLKFQKTLKEFNHSKDTISGIKLHFGKQMKYEVFIRILEILNIEKTPTYIPYEQELFIVNPAPSDIEKQRKRDEEKYGPRTQMNCGTQDYSNQQMKLRAERAQWIANENLQKSFFNQHWYLFLAYFGIVYLNIYTLIIFNRYRKYNQISYI